jgi:formylglycine-generating enzyme required for sulfatase activity
MTTKLYIIVSGSWYSIARYCQSAYHVYGASGYRRDYLGFRLITKRKV